MKSRSIIKEKATRSIDPSDLYPAKDKFLFLFSQAEKIR